MDSTFSQLMTTEQRMNQSLPLQLPHSVSNIDSRLYASSNYRLNVPSEALIASYYNGTPTRWVDPAKEAFEHAVTILKKEMSPDDCALIWLDGKNSMRDVHDALVGAQRNYRDRSEKSKIRSILSSCSSRIIYYAPVFDTLSQQYPEYVSLAWGAFKFLFTAVINHEELLAEFARAIADLAVVLPRTNLLSELYPTEEMQNAIAQVYAKIIEFILEAVRWYKKSKLKHALAAVVNPYKLSFKAIVDDIADRSRRVDDLANVACKAELRVVHMEVGTLRSELMLVGEQFRMLNQTLKENRILQTQMAMHQEEQNALLLEWHMEKLRHALESSDSGYGDAEQVLAFSRSLRNRRRLKTPTQIPRHEIPKLGTWATTKQSSLLLAQGNGIRTSSVDFAVDVLDIILEAQEPIIWALSSEFQETPSLIHIIQSLVLQTLMLKSRPGSTRSDMHALSVRDFSSAKTESEWIDILERCLRRIDRLFVVIDVDMIQKACSLDESNQRRMDTGLFVQRIRDMMSKTRCCVKVVFVSSISELFETPDSETSIETTTILTDRGVAQERRLWTPRLKAMARRQVRMSLFHFRMMMDSAERSRNHPPWAED